MISQARIPHVVIVGAGFAGLHTARGLRSAPVRVTVIDRTNHHLFQPLLYQVATASLSPADISAPIRGVLGKHANTEVMLGEVTGVDVQRQRVLMDDQVVSYDYLVLATGVQHNYFGHNEWKQYATGLKTLQDATAIQRKILLSFENAEQDPEHCQALLTFVVVGAGPAGVEMTGAVAELAHKALASDFRHIDPKLARVLLVEAGPRILPTFPESLAKKAHAELTRLGVEVRTNCMVEGVDERGVVIGGEHLAAKTVVWMAGVRGSSAGMWLGAEMDSAGRVKVLPDLSVAGQPNIFVIGDNASVLREGKPLPGLAPVAVEEGRYVASVIADRIAGKVHTQPFRYRGGGTLATVGRAYGVVTVGKMRLTGFLAWVAWLFFHIFFLIGYRNRFIVMFQWALAFFTFKRTARVILADNPIASPMRQEESSKT
ncbi:MAG: NAD(P)/FAD-dependent oxidoreductase [Ktedonobacteraceae bacterium]